MCGILLDRREYAIFVEMHGVKYLQNVAFASSAPRRSGYLTEEHFVIINIWEMIRKLISLNFFFAVLTR